MDCFSYIGQKIFNKSNKIFNVKKMPTSTYNNFSFWRDITENEYKINAEYFNIFLYSFMDYNSNKFLKDSKHRYLKKYISNIFISKNNIETVLDGFEKIQKVYNGFSMLLRLYKYKKAKILIKTDLMLNDIDSTQKNVITIIQNGHKYLFTIQDILKVIKNSICNSPNYFSESMPCKNPYNNLIFNKSTLYNIYFFVKRSNLIMPDYLQNFFLCNFNLRLFMDTNETIIRNHSIKSRINNLLEDDNYNYIISMLNYFNQYRPQHKKIKINKMIPKKEIIKIFKPYFSLYMMYRFSNCETTQENNKMLLMRKLEKFIQENPRFGNLVLKKRKYGKPGYIISFNLKHVNYYESDAESESFLTNHSYIVKRTLANENRNNLVIYNINRNVDVEVDTDVDIDDTNSTTSSRTVTDIDDDDDDDTILVNVVGPSQLLNDIRTEPNMVYDAVLSDDGNTIANLFDDIDSNIEQIIQSLNNSL